MPLCINIPGDALDIPFYMITVIQDKEQVPLLITTLDYIKRDVVTIIFSVHIY